jgi:hypothetical protein
VRFLEAWALLKQEADRQRELERRRREYIDLQKHPLNYPLIEALVNAAAKQNPGFYSEITFPGNVKVTFGVRDRVPRSAPPHDETF